MRLPDDGLMTNPELGTYCVEVKRWGRWMLRDSYGEEHLHRARAAMARHLASPSEGTDAVRIVFRQVQCSVVEEAVVDGSA